MDIIHIVKELRIKHCYKNIIDNEECLINKLIYCKYYLSSNQYGPYIENYIKKIFGISLKHNNISGDGVLNNKNIEIKCSLGTNKNQFNIVQIRPDHNIDYYLILFYNIYEGEIGKVYWYLIPHKDMINIVLHYGNYAHGTISKNGIISNDNILGNNYEYALRPNPYTNPKSKSFKLWNELLKYNYTYDDIFTMITQ